MKPVNRNTITVPTGGSTVEALRRYFELQAAAEIGRKRRKLAEKLKEGAPAPLAREQRVRNYANQSGWTADFTPAQRRRLKKKSKHLDPAFGRNDDLRIQGVHPDRLLTVVDEVRL